MHNPWGLDHIVHTQGHRRPVGAMHCDSPRLRTDDPDKADAAREVDSSAVTRRAARPCII